jgi:hypothetical protein
MARQKKRARRPVAPVRRPQREVKVQLMHHSCVNAMQRGSGLLSTCDTCWDYLLPRPGVASGLIMKGAE